MRKTLISLAFVFASMTANAVDISLSIGSPNLHIGVNVREYPNLVPIRGYPVYYSPDIDSNYFFYDGLYWVYQDDNWYASSWYNGPWSYVDPYAVPVYVLRVPVRYYHRPPAYFRGWAVEAPPRWDDHWGHEWHERRHDWDRWDHRNAPRPLPLPLYQRQYGGDRYPDADRQRDLQQRNYRYQPRNPVVAEHFKNERQQNDQWRVQHQQGRNESRDVYERRQQQEREEQQQKARRDEDQRQQNQRQQERQRQSQQQEVQQQEQQRQEQTRREEDQRRQERDRRQQEQQHREEEQRQQTQRQQQEQQQQARRVEDQHQQSRRQEDQRQQQARQQENQQAKQREEQQRQQQAQQQSQEQQRQAEQRQQQARQQQEQQRQQQQNQPQQRQGDQQRQPDDKRERPRENQRNKDKSDKDRDNENK